MSKVVVTGAAGFIGSHLAEALAGEGHEVVALDCFTAYYPRSAKEQNFELVAAAGCDAIELDVASPDLDEHLRGVDTIFHLAGQPGVRLSWADGFGEYDRQNILVTQKLLEAARRAEVRRLVYSSSSSVYGDAEQYPTTEDLAPRPVSPYGVTKLAGEHLTSLYGQVWGLSTISLRYFTVYGPRQRPDMAFHRIIESTLGGPEFRMFGDGCQIRDFTYVGDVVRANLAAMTCSDLSPGEVVNVSGGSEVDMRQVLSMIEELAGARPDVVADEAQAGDARRTGGDGARAYEVLDWKPEISLIEGLAAQLEWHRARKAQQAALTLR